MTISAVFAMLWLHKKQRLFYLFFSFGFLASAVASAVSYYSSSAFTAYSIFSLCAHAFWISAILLAQGRRLQSFCLAPLLIFILLFLIPQVRETYLFEYLAFHLANAAGFCLMAFALITAPGHRSKMRKILSLSVVGYGLLLALTGTALLFLRESDSNAAGAFVYIETLLKLFGLTFILMSAAKMVIEDTERRLTHLALTDHLTGIYNLRALDKVFEEAKSASSSTTDHLSITMFDIDHFKKINDLYGHAFGDFVLTNFVNLV